MPILTALRAALAWLGRQGTRALAVSVFFGLAVPQLAVYVKPYLGETVSLAYVDQSRETLDADKTVYEEITGGVDNLVVGGREIHGRAYAGQFGFKGTDKILRSHSAEILSPLCGRSSPALFAGKNRPANADSRRLAWTPPGGLLFVWDLDEQAVAQ